MDQVGIAIAIGSVAIVLAVILAASVLWRHQNRRVAQTAMWSTTEATIESGALEGVHESRAILPVFAFSYSVSGEYYSGRFGLIPSGRDADALIANMVGRKLQVRYDPQQPEAWFIPDKEIDGCKVEQKIGPHVVGLYPKD